MDKELVVEFLSYSICHYMDIKDFLLKKVSFCEYTLEIIACIVITGKRRLALNIWPKKINQDTDSNDIILLTWYNKAIKQRKINHQ